MNVNTSIYDDEKIIKQKMDTYIKFTEAQEEFIEKVKTNIEEDCVSIDETNLVSESNKAIQGYSKYSLKYTDAKSNYITLNVKINELRGHLYDYYKFNWDKSTKITDGAVEKYILSHPLYNKLFILLENQKNLLDLLERTLEYFKNKNFTIKNMIEIRKINLGMM